MENPGTFYTEMRKLANDNVVRSATSFDHIIFVATTGALILASGLIEKFQNPNIFSILILLFSITSLLTALFLHSLSYQRSIKYNKLVVEELDVWFKTNGQLQKQDSIIPFLLPEPNVKINNNARNSLDNWSFRCMWMGIILLTLFIIINLLTNATNDRRHQTGQTRFHKISR
jgi:hypothetical protein